MPHYVRLFVFFIILTTITGCSNSLTSSDDDSTSETSYESTVNEDSYSDSVAESSDTWDSEDLLSSYTFSDTVYINLTDLTASVGSGTANSFDGSSLAVLDDTITISSDDNELFITSTSEDYIAYELSGESTLTLTIESASEFKLILNDASITASAGPAVNITSAVKAFIAPAADTENSLTDNASWSSDFEDPNASFYSQGILIFCGEGSLIVNGDHKHGICSEDYIRVSEGSLAVNVSVRDGIRSVNGFILDDGILTVTATGTTQDDESKGIKVEGDESSDGAGLGYIVINGGTLTITSVSKGITASWDIDDDAETTSTDDDPDPSVTINSGVITITTTGESYETATASCSPEGIEGKESVVINSGYISVSCADDCVNAGSAIEINGGFLYCISSDNDAIDSNGTLKITAGVIVAVGTDAPESAFDCDDNTFSITGGDAGGNRRRDQYPHNQCCDPEYSRLEWCRTGKR